MCITANVVCFQLFTNMYSINIWNQPAIKDSATISLKNCGCVLTVNKNILLTLDYGDTVKSVNRPPKTPRSQMTAFLYWKELMNYKINLYHSYKTRSNTIQ